MTSSRHRSLVVSTGTPPAQIGTYRAKSRHIAKFTAFAPLRVKSRLADLARRFGRKQGGHDHEIHGRSRGADDAAEAEFLRFQR